MKRKALVLSDADRKLALSAIERVKASGLSPEAFCEKYAGKEDPDASTLRRWLNPKELPARMSGKVRRFFRRIVQEQAGDVGAQVRESRAAYRANSTDHDPYRRLDQIMDMAERNPDRVDLANLPLDFALATRCIASMERARAMRIAEQNAGRDSREAIMARRQRRAEMLPVSGAPRSDQVGSTESSSDQSESTTD